MNLVSLVNMALFVLSVDGLLGLRMMLMRVILEVLLQMERGRGVSSVRSMGSAERGFRAAGVGIGTEMAG